MNAATGWRVVYSGITLLALGAAFHSGFDAGLITAGIVLILAGGWQVFAS